MQPERIGPAAHRRVCPSASVRASAWQASPSWYSTLDAPRDQATWAFTDGDDALAMADFLNARVGKGEEIAWVEVVPHARKLNKKALRYLDCWAALTEETCGEDERAE